VYTTFHHPISGANVITTDNSDWATNCPEYKVTAVQIEKVESRNSDWQTQWRKQDSQQRKFVAMAEED
jgi:formate dehydrogenase major subunit